MVSLHEGTFVLFFPLRASFLLPPSPPAPEVGRVACAACGTAPGKQRDQRGGSACFLDSSDCTNSDTATTEVCG